MEKKVKMACRFDRVAQITSIQKKTHTPFHAVAKYQVRLCVWNQIFIFLSYFASIAVSWRQLKTNHDDMYFYNNNNRYAPACVCVYK